MSAFVRCPDCGKTFSEKTRRCTCGGIIEVAETPDPFRCKHVEYGEQCKHEGTVCKSVRGNKWLCREHAYHRPNYKK